jgi:hypothetical protein
MLKAQIREEEVHQWKLIGFTISNPNEVLLFLQIIRAAFLFSIACLYCEKLPFENTFVILN